jgi:hypothetical protein
MDLEQWTAGGRGFGAIFVFLLMAGEIYRGRLPPQGGRAVSAEPNVCGPCCSRRCCSRR